MPSFADKLTDKEKADLAAFVGAGKASGKPVVKPFAPDDKRVADCQDGDTECFEQSFGNLVFRDGPKPALERLQNDDGRPTRRSPRTATASRTAWARRRSSASRTRSPRRSSRASPVCWSGYYHGIVERAFLGQPEDKLAVVARQLCERPADQRPALPRLPVHPRPRARPDDLHRLRPARLAEDLRRAEARASIACPAAAACSWRTSRPPTASRRSTCARTTRSIPATRSPSATSSTATCSSPPTPCTSTATTSRRPPPPACAARRRGSARATSPSGATSRAWPARTRRRRWPTAAWPRATRASASTACRATSRAPTPAARAPGASAPARRRATRRTATRASARCSARSRRRPRRCARAAARSAGATSQACLRGARPRAGADVAPPAPAASGQYHGRDRVRRSPAGDDRSCCSG